MTKQTEHSPQGQHLAGQDGSYLQNTSTLALKDIHAATLASSVIVSRGFGLTPNAFTSKMDGDRLGRMQGL